MASSSPKLAHKSSVMNVAVVGLTSSSQGDQGEGTGKSCLCNKFVTPHADHYFTNHPYIVNLSEFGNSVINNCHFLYWGDKSTALEDGSQVRFRIIEHTEFVEDMSFKPFPSQKPYHKRITVTKLQSGGKLQYVEPNQLTLPEDFPDVDRFPDRSINIEGFIVCVDVSAEFSPNSRYRSDTLKLIQVVQGAKKPLVIALTKCDRVGMSKIAEVGELLSKIRRAPSVVEISSHDGVNVDLCFLVLAHLIDSRKPKVRIVPYDEAYSTVKDRKTRNEKLFKSMLDKKLNDFTLSKSVAIGLVKHEPEWETVAEILGSSRCEKLVGVKLGQLQVEAVMKQTEIFKEILPEYLRKVIPSVTLDETVDGCIEIIKNHKQFDSYFVNINNWTEDVKFLHLFSNKVPLAFVQKEGRSIVQEHLTALHLEIKRDHAKEVIRKKLEETEDLKPGVKAKVAVENLGLCEEAELLEPDVLVKIYQERINVIEQQCANDIHELLLERLDLFYDYIPDPKEIAEKLMDEPCMKKMELASTRRNGIIVKHISYLEVLERGPYFTPEILEILKTNTPSLEALRDSLHGHWASDPETEVFNLVLLSSSSEDASILKSDIMNQCTGADIYAVNNNRSYQLRMKCCHTGNEEMTSEKFIPQGIIFIISSLDQLEWVGDYARRNFISPSSLYRGMPCVLLVITDDLSDESELLVQSERLAANLQCILVSTPPTELPGRLVPPEIVNSVLPSLFDNFSITHSFIYTGPSRELDGLNFGVFCLPGDPSSVSTHLKSTLLSSQLIHFNDEKGIFFSKTALERQHKVVSLSFYSTINARDFPSCPVLGFIVFYSANRKASLSAVKWLIPRLHHIPILLVAICDDQSSSTLIDEGRAYAKERGEKVEFIVCYSQLEALKLSQFYSQCFFSRFTSWRSQGLSEEVSARILKRRGNNSTRPLPMPVGGNGNVNHQTLPKSLSRHSVALGGEFEKSPSLRGHFSMKSMKLSSKTKKPKVQPVSLSDDELDDSVYSDPNEVIKKFTKSQKRSPSELHKSNPAIASSLPPPASDKERFNTLPLDSSSLTQYAMVPSSNTLDKLDTLTRKRRAGHETSPSRDSVSTPDSAQLSNDSLYSPVKESTSKHELSVMYSSASSPDAVYPNAIYDHLTPRSQRRLLEHQNQMMQSEGVYSLADDTEQLPVIHSKAPPLPSQPPPSRPTEPHLYNTFNSTQLQLQNLQSQLNFVTEGIEIVRSNTGSPSKRSQSPTAIYDFCEEPSETQPHQLNLQSYSVKTLEGSPSPQKHPTPSHSQSPFTPPDYSSVPGDLPGSVPAVYDYASLPETRYSLQTQSHEGTPEAVYSLAEDTPSQSPHKPVTPPRKSPLIRNATPPPVIPPKPVVVHDLHGNFWTNKQAGTTPTSTTPTSTPPMTRAIEHVTPIDTLPEMIYAIPGSKSNQPPKKIPHMASVDNPDMIYAIPDKVPKSKPKPSHDEYEDDDDDDDAPPPLPPRNYDLSDIEDDDEECFHSEDEDDHKKGSEMTTPSHSKPNSSTGLTPQPIGVYASLEEIMDDDDAKSDGTEDSLALEQMESIYQNLNKFRKQQEQLQSQARKAEAIQEESIYDSLEKILEDVSKGKVATAKPEQATPTITMSTVTKSPQPKPPQLALSKKAIKLLKKNEKKAQKDIKKRLKLEAKQKKKEEEKRRKMEKALKKGKKIKQPIRKRYFESSLDSVVGDDGIPSFVKACIKIVERDGLESVGLYRISGKREDILKVQEMYDNDPNVDIDSIGVCTNAITGALKNFFKLLPESLIPEKMLPPLLDIPGSSNISDQISKMREIYSSLPRANLATLRYLCEHLHKVQKSHEINKMTSSNLSIVFWPTLMRPPIMDLADPTKQLGWQLAMTKMIENPTSVPEPATAV